MKSFLLTLQIIIVLFLSFSSKPGFADNQFIFTGSISTGGDTLVTATNSSNLKAGGFLQLGAGMLFNINTNTYVESSLGWKFDSVTAENGDANFNRFPVDIIVNQVLSDKYHLGLGVTYHLNPKLDLDIDNQVSGSIDFDNALGTLINFGLQYDNMVVGLRYTTLDYEVDSLSIDGNNVALFTNFKF